MLVSTAHWFHAHHTTPSRRTGAAEMLLMESLMKMALSMRSQLALSDIDVHVTLLVGMWLQRMDVG